MCWHSLTTPDPLLCFPHSPTLSFFSFFFLLLTHFDSPVQLPPLIGPVTRPYACILCLEGEGELIAREIVAHVKYRLKAEWERPPRPCRMLCMMLTLLLVSTYVHTHKHTHIAGMHVHMCNNLRCWWSSSERGNPPIIDPDYTSHQLHSRLSVEPSCTCENSWMMSAKACL